MSGEATGSIFGVFALPFLAIYLVVQTIKLIVIGVNKATQYYEEKQRQKRNTIRQSNSTIGDYRQTIRRNMNEQTQRNTETSQKMMQTLQTQRDTMLKAAEKYDDKAYQEYIINLKNEHTKTMQSITRTQDDFQKSYRAKIAESMNQVTQTINTQYSTYMSELQQIQADLAQKDKKAVEIANIYLEEAKTLLTALTEDFDGHKFSQRQLATLNEQYNQAVSLYNSGRFEGAIASAKDVAVNTLEEIYEADAKKQEWENYHKLAFVLSEEVKTFITSQATITAEVKQLAEQNSGKQLEAEIVGTSIAQYTDKNQAGQTRYDVLLQKTNEIYEAIRHQDAQNLTTDQLKEYVSYLNNDLYPQIAECINKGISNMNNAFSRQNISEEIIAFFEEHNFMFSGYAYENDAHDQALHIGLQNDTTGEELIITLAPELVQSGDVQTHIDIKQIAGDEQNEERKAYYRQCVADVVKGKNPYAKVDIKCKAETKNRLSTDTETKRKLKQ